MFCTKCGRSLNDNMKFCPKCGTKRPNIGEQHSLIKGTNPFLTTENVVITTPKLSISVCYESNGNTETVELVLPCVIGRNHECLPRLTDGKVSQQHARVYLENNAVMIEDLNSMNGTYVNGEKINEPVELLSGDEVIVGTTTLLFVVSAED